MGVIFINIIMIHRARVLVKEDHLILLVLMLLTNSY